VSRLLSGGCDRGFNVASPKKTNSRSRPSLLEAGQATLSQRLPAATSSMPTPRTQAQCSGEAHLVRASVKLLDSSFLSEAPADPEDVNPRWQEEYHG
jgi:hypothetical protein